MVQRRIEGAAQAADRDARRFLLHRVQQRIVGRGAHQLVLRRVQDARPALAAGALPGRRLGQIVRHGAAEARAGPAARRRRYDARPERPDRQRRRVAQVERFHLGELVAQLGEAAHLLPVAGIHLFGSDHLQHLAEILQHLLERLRCAQVQQHATLNTRGEDAIPLHCESVSTPLPPKKREGLRAYLHAVIVAVDYSNHAPGARLQAARRHVVHLGDGRFASESGRAGTAAPSLVAGRGVPHAVLFAVAGRLVGGEAELRKKNRERKEKRKAKRISNQCSVVDY